MALLFPLAPAPRWAACAQELPSDYVLQLARVDYFLRKADYTRAADELGRVPKRHHGELLFRHYLDKVLAGLYGPPAGRAALTTERVVRNRASQRLRVTRKQRDADTRSDQTPDNRGWQVNQHLEADVEGKDNLRTRWVLDLEGYRNGHNDARYRTVLADFYTDPTHHLALGDSATFPGNYFMRGSRVRGMNLLLSGPEHEFQAVLGAYPFWLESRDQYIYPRDVMGLHDRWRLFGDRVRFAANLIKSRDSEKIRTIDVVNQPRDNTVFSLDQEVKLIPDVWFLKASEAWSTTDDNLIEDRFGDTSKLKDSAFILESLLIQPWGRSNTFFQRTGPDFRLLNDIPSGSVVNSKGFTSDRQLIEEHLDFNPWGPLDLDLEASWQRNNLDSDSGIEQTRQSWYTANLGILVPPEWPRPRLRGTWIDTTSVPGSTTRSAEVRTFDLRQELTYYLQGIHWTQFADFVTERPVRDQGAFDEEERWSVGTRLGIPLIERILVSPHYRFLAFDELFDEVREKGISHEAGVNGSVRLWSTASLGLSYTFLHGKLTNPGGTRMVHAEGHAGTASFTWPYTGYRWDRKRKLTFFPGVTIHLTDLSQKSEQRPLIVTRLTTAYEAFADWKVELMGEYRYDDDKRGDRIRGEESRLWLLWSSR